MRGLGKWRAVWLALAGWGITVGAQASTIPAGTYDLTGVKVDGYELTGTVTMNSSGIIDAADLELDDAALDDPLFTTVNSVGHDGSAPVTDYAYIDSSVGQVDLQYLTGVNSAGDVELCLFSANDCNGYQASYLQIYSQSSLGYNPVELSSGALDPGGSATVTDAPVKSAAITPEVGTLALLGTGILGIAGLTRKRKRG